MRFHKYLQFAIVAIVIMFFGLLGYLIYKAWDVFGPWAMVISILLNLTVVTPLLSWPTSRVKTRRGMLINPREGPRYAAMAVCLAIGYFLWTRLSDPRLSESEVLFGYIFLCLCMVIPLSTLIFRTYRDRNDFVEIDGSLLRYFNEGKMVEVSLEGLREVQHDSLEIRLCWEGNEVHVLPLGEMNFNMADRQELRDAIDALIAKA